MDHPPQVSHYLTVHVKQNPVLLTELLDAIFELINAMPDLHRDVPYKLTRRGQNDKNRLARIQEYQGPDPATTDLLDSYHKHWLNEPQEFWQKQMPSHLAHLDPQSQIVGFYLHAPDGDPWACMVRRCSCVLLLEFRERRYAKSQCTIAADPIQRGHLGSSTQEITSAVDAMIDEGSRFRNIERRIGEGTALVLGTAMPKTFWKKVIGKKGDRFEVVMEHLRNIGIPEMAANYRILYRAILDYQHGVLKTCL